MARESKPERAKLTWQERSEKRRRASAIANQAKRERAKQKEPLTSLRIYASDNRTLNEICAAEKLKNRQDTVRHLIRHYRDTHKPREAVE